MPYSRYLLFLKPNSFQPLPPPTVLDSQNHFDSAAGNPSWCNIFAKDLLSSTPSMMHTHGVISCDGPSKDHLFETFHSF